MKKCKVYWEMTTKELAEATKEFDEDFVFEKTKPLSAEGRRQLAVARKRSRSGVGSRTASIRVTIERGLLRKADRYARKSGIGRSELIARGLRAVMAEK